ncbi:DNA-directed RNA polymerase III subunit RPC4 [Neocloeon triangulifer]|uniref:DNA-directed RNA polymerase III subunit RPC4 n=1 Tax=Neocloeon triangulifer TaxID=2078957 RepID=UPI00286F3241|nr:DNA-directed RNA polymerase III subunit RPC4 [Neocloeon triangulifer]
MADPGKPSMGLPSLGNGLLSLGARGKLESFRTPRDLTLGVKQKRKFEPTLPKKGKAKTSPVKASTPVSSPSRESKSKEPPAKKARKRPPKDRVAFIQTEGSVFGQGQAERQFKVKDHYVCSSAASSSKKTEVSRPILKKEELIEVQEEYAEAAEDEVVLKMKRADFLDNPEAKASWGDSKPLLIQQKVVTKVEIKADPDAEEDVSPTSCAEPENQTVSGVLGRTNELFLIQFPDCLPGRVEKQEEISEEPSSSGTSKTKKSIPATLSDLPEGLLGYIEILKSGKARLKMGNHSMCLEMAASSNIRQEIISVDVNGEDRSGSMCDLGQVNDRLVCVPDWHSELLEAFQK